jgi:hypothetical protein
MLYLLTCFGTDTDTALLPHFLGHYRNQGVQRFLVILHAKSSEMARMAEARDILAAFGIIAEEEWGGVYTSQHFFRTSAFRFPVISSAVGWREASGLGCCRPEARYGGKDTGRRRGDYSRFGHRRQVSCCLGDAYEKDLGQTPLT